MDSALAAIIGAGVGSFVTGLSMVIITCINRKSEERRHKKELAVRLAAEEYREIWKHVGCKGGVMPSPQIYFIYALKFMNEIDFSKGPKELAEQMEKIENEAKELIELKSKKV